MSEEKGVIDTLIAAAVGALAYMGYVEARMRGMSSKREEQGTEIARLQENTCTSEQVRAILKDEIAETKESIKDIYQVVNEINVTVGKLK